MFQVLEPTFYRSPAEAIAVPLVSRQSGLVAQQVGRPRDPSSTEYVYVTVWEDAESIRAFAGERWQEAVITRDEAHLLSDTWIGHYEALPFTRMTFSVSSSG
jgi:heme-degrading monooxygenase HmoA